MRFRDLPGFSAFFADYADGEGPARSFFPCPPDASSLRQRAAAAAGSFPGRTGLGDFLLGQAERFRAAPASLANIRKLTEGHAVAVTATLTPALFGGPLCGWLKACTAVRLAAWLETEGIPAVPVGWVHRAVAAHEWTVPLLSTPEPVRFHCDGRCNPDGSIPQGIDGWIQELSSLLDVSVEDSDVLRTLRVAYRAGSDPVVAWGKTLSALLAPWGLILVDPLEAGGLEAVPGLPLPGAIESVEDSESRRQARLRDAGYVSETARYEKLPAGWMKGFGVAGPVLAQNLLFPVAAHVVGESDIFGFALDQAVLEELGRPSPVAWPRSSVTLADARSRKMMARYDLSLGDLFHGPDAPVARLVGEPAFRATRERLETWKLQMEGHLAGLAALVPPDDRLARSVARARVRMTYQMEKLNTRFLGSHRVRAQSIQRQVARLCVSLAPWGGLQEREIAGFQFLLRHSSALPQKLAGIIDPFRFEHQLIFLD